MPSSPDTDALTAQLRAAKPLKTKQFNIMMSPDEFQKLLRLSARMETSMAGAVRAALDRTYAMTIDKIPTCGTGMPCPFPHVHMTVPGPGTPAPVPAPQPPEAPAA